MFGIKRKNLICLLLLVPYILLSDAYAQDYTKFDHIIVDGLDRPIEGASIKIYKSGESGEYEVIKEILSDKKGHFEIVIYEKMENLRIEISKKGYRSFFYDLDMHLHNKEYGRKLNPEKFNNWSTSNPGFRRVSKGILPLKRLLDLSEIENLLNLEGEKLEQALNEILTATYEGESVGVSNFFKVFEVLFHIEDHISDALKKSLSTLEVNEGMEAIYSLITDPEKVKYSWQERKKNQIQAVSSTNLDEAIELAVQQIIDKSAGDEFQIYSKTFNRNKNKVLVNCAITKNRFMGKFGPIKDSAGYYLVFYKIDDLWWTLKVIKTIWIS